MSWGRLRQLKQKLSGERQQQQHEPCVVSSEGDSKPDDKTVPFEEESELDEVVSDGCKILLEEVKTVEADADKEPTELLTTSVVIFSVKLADLLCDVDKIPLEAVKLAAVIEETVAFRLMLTKILYFSGTIELELGDVVVDRSVEFTLPGPAGVEVELGVGKTNGVFSVLEASGDAVVDDEDGLDPVVVEREEANEQNWKKKNMKQYEFWWCLTHDSQSRGYFIEEQHDLIADVAG